MHIMTTFALERQRNEQRRSLGNSTGARCDTLGHVFADCRLPPGGNGEEEETDTSRFLTVAFGSVGMPLTEQAVIAMLGSSCPYRLVR